MERVLSGREKAAWSNAATMLPSGPLAEVAALGGRRAVGRFAGGDLRERGAVENLLARRERALVRGRRVAARWSARGRATKLR